ncbi:putative Ig domain-containing protein [Streptacidiphilus melanogenes]|uniref:putative Ig domain-containing protein n=1 Tax=Streptacidiphilus melanogenes TaxID=411235 RepID=UPI0005A9CB00|nr:putative Ig domain-containing protein [Streptacidiphilus melanogenes]
MLRTSSAGRSALLASCTSLAVAAAVAAAPGATAAPTSAASAHTTTTAATAASSTVRHILFDDSKSETAGNSDWIISTSKPDPLQQNPNPQTETDWTGAISAWGVALQKTGDYSLDTLPPGNTITYGDTGNPLDLSHFDTFVLPEPQDQLSAAEKAAVMHYVQNGGGLFLVVDHTGSDRNNNGWDSPAIVNDLLTNNGVDNNDPFGFSVDLKNIVSDAPRAISDATDPVLHGSFGDVTGSVIYNGTTETLHPADNPNVKGLVYTTGSTAGGSTGAFFTTSAFGSGRVAIWGDSSAIDDGTGEPGHTVEDGWDDPKGTDAALALNATSWLASGTSGGGAGNTVTVANPGNQTGTVGAAASLQVSGSDSAGAGLTYTATGLPTGLGISATGLISGTPTSASTSNVTVTATDSTGASGSASFTWTVNSTGGGGGCTSAQLLGNPGFETGSASPWTASSSVVSNSSNEPAHSGSWDAWLDGYGTTHTDTLAQTVTVPAGCTNTALSFWLHVDTAETSTTTAYDTLKVQVLNSSGTVLATLATYSNLNHNTGYTQHTFSLAPYAGQTVTLKFTGAEDKVDQTSFVLDDTAVNAG